MATRNHDLLIWRKLESGLPSCIDGVFTDDNGIMRGLYSGETLEQLGKRYPNPVITTIDEYNVAHEAAWTTKPERITEEQYMQMLEVLPPLDWEHGKGWECFKLVERISGSITNIYARVGAEYWSFRGRDDMSAADIIAKVKEVQHAC